ncbi:MAG TPA: tetratricopeptide repeat protein [Pyrinomonadaceae bacterium]|nr:tetratricopeptide repeat protein [Pyrinomonadaceae bacterium]
MKLLAKIELNFVFIVVIVLFLLISQGFGQNKCTNDEGTVTCSDRQQPACSQGGGRFDGHCTSPNANLLIYGNEEEFEADYATKVTGVKTTVEDLRQNPSLKQGLREGRLQLDGKIITFTPISEVKKLILENPSKFETYENRFLQRMQLDGLDDAIEEYKKHLSRPTTIWAQPDFLGLGNRFVREKRFTDAIKIFKLNVEINKGSEEAFFKLGEAYELIGDKERAIENFEKVVNNNEKLKSLASEKINILRKP